MATRTQTLTIAASGTVSSAFDASDCNDFTLVLPAALTGTALTFQVSADGSTFAALYDASNAAVSLTVTQGRAYALPTALAGCKAFKIVSGSSEAAERSLVVSGKLR